MSSKEPKFEIIAFSGERMSLFSLQYFTIFLICIFLIIIGWIFYIIFFPSLVAPSISFGILIIFLIFSISGNQGMLRKFTITETTIEILLPKRNPFTIRWAQIDEIKVRLKILNVNPFQFYEITFLGEKEQIKIYLNLKDFERANLMKILKALKIETNARNKKFSATKEEIVSGIYLISDLGI